MSAETRRDVVVEYPVDVVYDSLIFLFPIKRLRLSDNDDATHSVKVTDTTNHTFVMHINLQQYTPNTTIIKFYTDYRAAVADLTGGGDQAINAVLEELLNDLKGKPATGAKEIKDTQYEVVNAQTFVNPSKTEKHTTLTIIGYVLCVLSIILPLIAFISAAPRSSTMAGLLIGGILCLSMGISVAAILLYYDNKTAKKHGLIQICLCGLAFVMLGLLIHIILAIVGIIITVFVIVYYTLRDRPN